MLHHDSYMYCEFVNKGTLVFLFRNAYVLFSWNRW